MRRKTHPARRISGRRFASGAKVRIGFVERNGERAAYVVVGQRARGDFVCDAREAFPIRVRERAARIEDDGACALQEPVQGRRIRFARGIGGVSELHFDVCVGEHVWGLLRVMVCFHCKRKLLPGLATHERDGFAHNAVHLLQSVCRCFARATCFVHHERGRNVARRR
jgi:hypothetical protein